MKYFAWLCRGSAAMFVPRTAHTHFAIWAGIKSNRAFISFLRVRRCLEISLSGGSFYDILTVVDVFRRTSSTFFGASLRYAVFRALSVLRWLFLHCCCVIIFVFGGIVVAFGGIFLLLFRGIFVVI